MSDRYGFLHDPESRRLRGRRIVGAFAELGGLDIARATVLDVGCSAGLVTEELARHAARVVGIDIDAEALAHAETSRTAALFARASAMALPFADASFDAVVCNHVYEHVPDTFMLLTEVRRVLREGGLCYFAAGHRLQLIEPHHCLPLLTWLPRPLASAWLRRTGRATEYEERFVAPWHLRRFFAGFASVELVSAAMLRAPERFGFPQIARLPHAVRRSVAAASEPLARLAPTWIFLLRR